MSHLLHAFLLLLVSLPYMALAFLIADSLFSRKTFMKEWPAYATTLAILVASHIALVFLMTRVFV